MALTAHSILLLLALVVFVVAALWSPSAPSPWSRVNLVAAGLAFLAAAFLVP